MIFEGQQRSSVKALRARSDSYEDSYESRLVRLGRLSEIFKPEPLKELSEAASGVRRVENRRPGNATQHNTHSLFFRPLSTLMPGGPTGTASVDTAGAYRARWFCWSVSLVLLVVRPIRSLCRSYSASCCSQEPTRIQSHEDFPRA